MKMDGKMKTFATTSFDWFNFVAQNFNSNALIQFVLRFDKCPDFDLLVRALRCCLMADPVLGCRFLVKDDMPQWVYAGLDAAHLFEKRLTEEVESAVGLCLAERLDASQVCPVKLCMVVGVDDARLVIKVHHAVCDAGGALQFVKMLAAMYGKVGDDPDFMPEPGIPCRGTEAFCRHFGVEDKSSRLDMSLLPDMRCTWGTPFGDVASGQTFAYQAVRFSDVQLDRMKTFAQSNGGSLNALVTLAYHKALVLLLNPEADGKEIQFSVNLRRFTDGGNTVCNLSNMTNVTLPTKGSLAELAAVAKCAIDKAVAPELMLQGVLACELMSTDFKSLDSFYASDWENVKRTGLCTPMISNVGKLDDAPICFGQCDVKDMMLISPAFVSPSFMLSVSTYRKVMTLCVAYQKPSMDDGFVTALLSEMKSMLAENLY